MKKLSVFFLFFLLSFSIHSEIPSELKGIWEGSDRILFIEDENRFSVIMKTFYGWYYDAVNLPENEKDFKKERNDSTPATPQHITVSAEKIYESLPVYELTVNFDEKTKKIIPLCISDDSIYLDFLCNENDSNLWLGFNTSENIRISPMKEKSEIFSWYIEGSSFYRLRFWKTDMSYNSDEKASFTDGENTYTVSKYIYSAGCTYTSASGRGKRIRNVEKFSSMPQGYTLDENKRILLKGTPSFNRSNIKSKEELIKIIQEANSRFAPLWPDPFEKSELDWHYDLINNLEKDNKIIQEVRKRQNDFGKRGKETER